MVISAENIKAAQDELRRLRRCDDAAHMDYIERLKSDPLGQSGKMDDYSYKLWKKQVAELHDIWQSWHSQLAAAQYIYNLLICNKEVS